MVFGESKEDKKNNVTGKVIGIIRMQMALSEKA
jgi:hypothetical protein